MILIFFIIFLPSILSIVLYFYINKDIKRYKKIPGFSNAYFVISENDLKNGFGKPVMADFVKLATFASIFLFIFLLFSNVFLFLVEIIILILLGTYFQNRANERLQELCDRYHIERVKK